MSDIHKYNILFGDKDDDRIKLFLHTVQKIASDKKKVITYYSDTNPVFVDESGKEVTKFMQNGLFENEKRIGNDFQTKIHPEWSQTLIDIILYVHDISTNTSKSKIKSDLISLMKELKKNINNDRNTIIKNLVRVFYNLNDKDDTVIPISEKSWEKISKISLNNDVLKSLFVSTNPIRISTSTPGKSNDPEDKLFNTYSELGNNIYKRINTDGINIASGRNRSDYSLDTYLAKLFNSAEITDEGSLNFWNENTSSIQTYHRDQDGNLYYYDNGNKIFINFDTLFKKIKTEMCKASGINGTNNLEDRLMCTEYIRDCLNGTSIEKCKKFLGSPETKFLVADEVKNMPPQIIESTVKALKLPIKQKNIKNMIIDTVGSSEEWLIELRSNGFTIDDINKIRNHETLMKYVNTIISTVNSEPAILNKNYISSNREINVDVFKGTMLYKYGLQPNFPYNYKYRTGNITLSDIERLHRQIIDYHQRIQNSFRMQYMIQSGGGINNIDDIYDDDIKLSYELFEEYIYNLDKMLEGQGKKIDNKDMDTIKNYLRSLETSEKSLKKAVRYINEYVKLLNSFGERDNVKNLKMDYLKKFVDQRDAKFGRLVDKELDMVSIVRAIGEAAN